MPIAKEKGEFIPAPEGTHIARCVDVISLGTQSSPMFPAAFKVMLGWELPDEMMVRSDTKEEKPLKVSKEFTLSLSKKANLRKTLESWRGKVFTKEELEGFEVSKLLDIPCLLSIIHKQSSAGKTYAAIETVSRLAKGMACKPRAHELVRFEIEEGRNEAFAKLPEWIQKKIETCEEWVRPQIDQEHLEEQAEEDHMEKQEEDDSVPF